MHKFILALVTALSGVLAASAWADKLPADPTKPATGFVVATTADEINEFKLSSLIIGAKQKAAVINGQRVEEGEQIDGAKVLSIQRQQVELLYKGESQVLTLGKLKGFSKKKSGK